MMPVLMINQAVNNHKPNAGAGFRFAGGLPGAHRAPCST